MVALKASEQEQVQAAHAAALAAGGSDEGAPGFRPPGGTSFYGAYFRDPVGNKFCVYAV
jgi:catechol 2,3-dioxygenase-like lactoylglutathione lyase family enzyme